MPPHTPQVEGARAPQGLERLAGERRAGTIRQHPLVAYFAVTFSVSWGAALCVALPWLTSGRALPDLAGMLMFPAMLLGPSVTGLAMTRAIDGPSGLRTLGSLLRSWRLGRWYAALVIPPLLVYGTLFCLQSFVSPAFAPNMFFTGVFFGIPAGYLEEIGWMGFAFEKLHARGTAFRAAVILGLMWALWHLPVVDFLGVAHPHRAYWAPFFLAFGAAMTAMRVLIVWNYVNTGSLLAAQLLHMSSTGALVVFAAPGVNAPQEVAWYALYALALWLVVAVVVRIYGFALTRSPGKTMTARREL